MSEQPANARRLRPGGEPSLTTALELQGGTLLALVGGGGKTSLMYAAAEELAAAGRRVVCTTTTKIFPPAADQHDRLLLNADADALRAQLQEVFAPDRRSAEGGSGGRARQPRVVVARRLIENGKLEGVPAQWPLEFLRRGLADVVLVEADGAARKPFKAPAAHEPVLPEGATMVAAVVGLDALGSPLDAEHVFRPEMVAELCAQAMGSEVSIPSITRVLLSPRGFLKDVPEGIAFCAVVNKVDGAAQLPLASKLGMSILRCGGRRVRRVILTRLHPSPTVLAILLPEVLSSPTSPWA
ncbi:MAG: putative selenium-dependent hydroxylase accessory protein YqeC [Candidatus Tectomicrobia bacterium]|nr:putative selenium-dependent hydroxylase accessory protein YqeC [Candidatus Tectomicrobia bacterium]